jgi:hypothetical protein
MLMKTGGADNLLGLIKEVGGGKSFSAALKQRYDKDLAKLQEDLESEVK